MHAGSWNGGHSFTVANENIYYLLTKQVKFTRLYKGNKFTACEETVIGIKDITNATLRLRQFGKTSLCGEKFEADYKSLRLKWKQSKISQVLLIEISSYSSWLPIESSSITDSVWPLPACFFFNSQIDMS